LVKLQCEWKRYKTIDFCLERLINLDELETFFHVYDYNVFDD